MKDEWKKEMDALYKRTEANWWKTGNRTCKTAVTGSLQLGKVREAKKEKK